MHAAGLARESLVARRRARCLACRVELLVCCAAHRWREHALTDVRRVLRAAGAGRERRLETSPLALRLGGARSARTRPRPQAPADAPAAGTRFDPAHPAV